jgi:hypothetical protein
MLFDLRNTWNRGKKGKGLLLLPTWNTTHLASLVEEKTPERKRSRGGGEQLNATAVENVGYSLCWPFVESLCARDRNNKAKPRQQQQKQPVSHTHKENMHPPTQKRKKRRNEYSTPRDRRSHLLKR